MTENVLPVPTPGSALLRVQGTSRLAFGATTAALVTLASGGTALLVNYGATNIGTATAMPHGAALPATNSDGGAVVVARPAGTFEAKPHLDKTVRALKAALAHRATPGRRTLLAPLLFLDPPTVDAPPPALPPALGPLVAPPALPPALGPLVPPVSLVALPVVDTRHPVRTRPPVQTKALAEARPTHRPTTPRPERVAEHGSAQHPKREHSKPQQGQAEQGQAQQGQAEPVKGKHLRDARSTGKHRKGRHSR